MNDEILPTQIIILGGSGDLSKRKLLPALLDLYIKNKLPTHFNIIGLARTQRSDEEYRNFVKSALTKHEHNHTTEQIDAFCEHVSYVKVHSIMTLVIKNYKTQF